MRGLYAIIDTESLLRAGLDVVRFGEAIVAARPGAIQLRDKRRDSRDHLRLLRALVPRCADAGIPLFANDRADLALIASCPGLHLGQHDIPPEEARSLAASRGQTLFIGMSVHNHEELAGAIEATPDYIALGPVFETRSKANPDPSLGADGLAALAEATRAAGPWPRVAIGGIDRTSAPKVAHLCEMAAVISALMAPDATDPYATARERARELHGMLGGTA